MTPNLGFTFNVDESSEFQIGNLYHKKEVPNGTLIVDKMKQQMITMN
jgi:hypothetical protein